MEEETEEQKEELKKAFELAREQIQDKDRVEKIVGHQVYKHRMNGKDFKEVWAICEMGDHQKKKKKKKPDLILMGCIRHDFPHCHKVYVKTKEFQQSLEREAKEHRGHKKLKLWKKDIVEQSMPNDRIIMIFDVEIAEDRKVEHSKFDVLWDHGWREKGVCWQVLNHWKRHTNLFRDFCFCNNCA